jgi:hypothetical protein
VALDKDTVVKMLQKATQLLEDQQEELVLVVLIEVLLDQDLNSLEMLQDKTLIK